MKKHSYIIVLITLMQLLINCSKDKSNKKIKLYDMPALDSSINFSEKAQIDSQMIKGVRNENSEAIPSVALEKEKLINSYERISKIDTILNVDGKNKMYLHIKYYCLFDNKLIIPQRYISTNNDSSTTFLTHNFMSTIVLCYNQDTIVNQNIDKNTFKKYLSSLLQQYGSLRMPYLYKITKDGITLNYSVSIPLTDIGVLMNVNIDKFGKFKISE